MGHYSFPSERIMGARSIDLCKNWVFITARERIGKAKISVSDGVGDCPQEKCKRGRSDQSWKPGSIFQPIPKYPFTAQLA
jgi:hypothetical protein